MMDDRKEKFRRTGAVPIEAPITCRCGTQKMRACSICFWHTSKHFVVTEPCPYPVVVRPFFWGTCGPVLIDASRSCTSYWVQPQYGST